MILQVLSDGTGNKNPVYPGGANLAARPAQVLGPTEPSPPSGARSSSDLKRAASVPPEEENTHETRTRAAPSAPITPIVRDTLGLAKSLANQGKENLGKQKLEIFLNDFNKFIAEYEDKYMLYSTAIKLGKLESFNKWLPKIIEDKDLFTSIIVDKMVNEQDLYSLSLYQNFYAGTNRIPNIDNEYQAEYYDNGGGENTLALISGCHWIEQSGNSILAE